MTRRVCFPRLFYDEAGNDVDTDQGERVMLLDPHKRVMDRPNVTSNNFNRGVDLNG